MLASPRITLFKNWENDPTVIYDDFKRRLLRETKLTQTKKTKLTRTEVKEVHARCKDYSDWLGVDFKGRWINNLTPMRARVLAYALWESGAEWAQPDLYKKVIGWTNNATR